MDKELMACVEDNCLSTKEKLKKGILATSGAKNVWIKENRAWVNINEINACSVSIFVEGGELERIYEAIEMYCPLGVATNGDIDVRGTRFYWVADIDYREQEKLVKKLNNKLHKEELLKQLAELGGDDE